MSTTAHSLPYAEAKQMIQEYRRHPRPIVGSEDSQGNLVQLDQLSFPKSALQVFVGIALDSVRMFFAINPTGKDAQGNLTFPSDPSRQTYTVILAGVKDDRIVHSTVLDGFDGCPPGLVVNL
jgi:hypothetical protein